MTMSICVYINGRQVAKATVTNLSGLADVSDYDVDIVENGEPALGISRIWKRTFVHGHPRRQSVWALVEKVAKAALDGRP